MDAVIGKSIDIDIFIGIGIRYELMWKIVMGIGYGKKIKFRKISL